MLVYRPNNPNAVKDFKIVADALTRMAVNPTAAECLLVKRIAYDIAKTQLKSYNQKMIYESHQNTMR